MAFNLAAAGKGPRRTQKPKPRKGLPDPLAKVGYTDNLEADSKAELTELAKAAHFRGVTAEEQKRYLGATDSEHWFCVVCRSRDEKQAALKALHVKTGIVGDKYIPVDALLAAVGVSIDKE